MAEYPLAPRNLFVTTPYIQYVQDVRFDDPSILPENSGFIMIGVNVWRSYDSEYGPYHKLTETPITTTRYRDELINTYVQNEDVTNRFASYGDNPRSEYVIQTLNFPIVKAGSIGDHAYTSSQYDVTVKIGEYDIFPLTVDGYNGQIYLPQFKWYCVNTKTWVDPILPETNNYVIEIGDQVYISPYLYIGQAVNGREKVYVSYHYRSNIVKTNIGRRIWYKVTSVALCGEDQIETPIEQSPAQIVRRMETTDYMWREMIRRNLWILQQAGLRVKLFIRPWTGFPEWRCSCWEGKDYHRAIGDCPKCYGTGWTQGYQGPWDIIISPPDTEKSLELTELGLHLDWVISTWTAPSPMIFQRDVIVFEDNRRFAVGPVNMKTPRGMLIQQHFDISLLDETDIRYKIPITGPDAEPVITDKRDLPEPDTKQIKGRTVRFEGITY